MITEITMINNTLDDVHTASYDSDTFDILSIDISDYKNKIYFANFNSEDETYTDIAFTTEDGKITIYDVHDLASGKYLKSTFFRRFIDKEFLSREHLVEYISLLQL